MRYFYDTEFIEDGRTIDLISIGIIAADGRVLYLQSSEFNHKKASPWVIENVFKNLEMCPYPYGTSLESLPLDIQGRIERELEEHKEGQCRDSHQNLLPLCSWRNRQYIAHELHNFMDIKKYGEPELWAYYGAYDHISLCQLFGKMIDLPEGYPMYTMDIKQWCKHLGNPRLPEQAKGEHNALADAQHVKAMYEFLSEYEKR